MGLCGCVPDAHPETYLFDHPIEAISQQQSHQEQKLGV